MANLKIYRICGRDLIVLHTHSAPTLLSEGSEEGTAVVWLIGLFEATVNNRCSPSSGHMRHRNE